VALRRDCTFASAVRFSSATRFSRSGRLVFRLRFGGNDALLPSRSAVRVVRTR
jgi:hypothetical protein